ncbi:histidine kinase [Diaphorobacter sp. HDW4A]|uniref:helix-turn-helix domain-containing protein n=1 Tax=Diaphorobacter sp. HDW4A TaxID=2714924 RepID=UPI001409A87E|nr:helix-turn-helix domain-containing protein [Diaphorobacter sp. HDW4A]QIL81060.1 histidine kinase [Diaphorobacter sp. HDW4A]
MHSQHDPLAEQRLQQIQRARTAVFDDEEGLCTSGDIGTASGFFMRPGSEWIERSWRRCLAQGQRPQHHVAFDVVTAHSVRRTLDAQHLLLQAARPALEGLGRATASTRYFAILTDASGVVVDVSGAVDSTDPRAVAIARVGVDLSERSIGTSAISAALLERRAVWLHRGEHFYRDTSMYSCAGAPVFGPTGGCVGMLDLTGVEVVERPELRHLVARAARNIENALTLRTPHRLLVRLNWPGQLCAGDGDGLLCLDEDGYVTGANQAARRIVSGLAADGNSLHSDELFAMPVQLLFDAARRGRSGCGTLEVPLWSGLRVQVQAQIEGPGGSRDAAGMARERGVGQAVPLKDIELAMVHQAVADARGNVAQAARALGISRATVYRKLRHKQPRS